MKKLFIMLIAALLALGMLAGCTDKDNTDDGSSAASEASFDPAAGKPVTDEQKLALENCMEYFDLLNFEGKEDIDTDQVTWQYFTDSMINYLWVETEGVPPLDSNDYVFTIGDPASEHYIMLVCDRDSSTIIGYLQQP